MTQAAHPAEVCVMPYSFHPSHHEVPSNSALYDDQFQQGDIAEYGWNNE